MNQNLIRLGYACLNSDLRNYDIFTSRKPILKTVTSQGFDYVKETIIRNLRDLFTIIIYNESHGIRFFRISSSIFPHLGNPLLPDSDYDLSFAKNLIKEIGSYAKINGHRLTMHPGQFVQLGSNNEEVVRRSFVELQNHATLLEMLGYSSLDSSVLIVHGGGTFGDKETTLERWKSNFRKLPENIRQLICLENDENSYGILDLLPVCEELNVPFCLDIFHNRVSKNRIPLTKKLMKRIINTWKRRNMTPKMHFSNQEPGLRRGAHSKTINELPEYLFRIPDMFQTSLDIMLEVKDKEKSVLKMYFKYFDIETNMDGRNNFTLKKDYSQKKIEFKNL
ncbi:endonuclease for the repair of UV-irradiated DNA [Acanthamoeba polyphaga lentillevirus]|nr:endonuclease for the repair of UV-irradiated DNA [Acanthamoeba polyphaga lentillevirus]